MRETRWIPTSPEVYAVIWARHQDEFQVFGTHTCMEGCEWHAEPYILTEWGFKDQDYPLIRAIRRGHPESANLTYWIAAPITTDGDPR